MPPDYDPELVERINELMKQFDCENNDEKFARFLDTTKQNVYMWRRTGRKLSWHQIKKICEKTGVDAEWLIFGESRMRRRNHASILELRKFTGGKAKKAK